MSSIDLSSCSLALRITCAVWLVTGHIAGAAASEAGSSAVRPATARVEVNLVGELADDATFAALLREWLDSSEIAHFIASQPSLALAELKASRAAGSEVRIWLVPLSSGRLRLYLADPRERRYLVRDIPLPTGLDELGRERAAQVVLTSALAFLERRASTPWREIERTFDEPADAPAPTATQSSLPRSPPARRPSSTSDTGDAWVPELGAGASYAAVASQGVAHGPGALLEFGAATSSARFAALLRGRYRFWPPARSPRVRIEARGPALEFGGAAELVLEGALRPFFEVGAGFDFVLVTPRGVPDSDIDARPPRDDARAFGVLSVGLKWRVPRVWVSAGARAEWDFAPTHYDVATESGVERELSLPRLRPGGFLEAGWFITARD